MTRRRGFVHTVLVGLGASRDPDRIFRMMIAILSFLPALTTEVGVHHAGDKLWKRDLGFPAQL
jgi:hypothetical protein